MPIAIPAALGSNFNEPQSDDPTSAPPMPDQQPQQNPQPMQAQGLAAALAKRKKRGLIGPTIKTPSALSAAIARSRRARPSGLKYG